MGIKKSRLTYAQIWWLDSRGGRTENDIEEDEGGLYCWFGSGGKLLKRVPLPKDEDIEIYISRKSSINLQVMV